MCCCVAPGFPCGAGWDLGPARSPGGCLAGIRQVVQRAASAASHLQGPETLTAQLDHLSLWCAHGSAGRPPGRLHSSGAHVLADRKVVDAADPATVRGARPSGRVGAAPSGRSRRLTRTDWADRPTDRYYRTYVRSTSSPSGRGYPGAGEAASGSAARAPPGPGIPGSAGRAHAPDLLQPGPPAPGGPSPRHPAPRRQPAPGNHRRGRRTGPHRDGPGRRWQHQRGTGAPGGRVGSRGVVRAGRPGRPGGGRRGRTRHRPGPTGDNPAARCGLGRGRPRQ